MFGCKFVSVSIVFDVGFCSCLFCFFNPSMKCTRLGLITDRAL